MYIDKLTQELKNLQNLGLLRKRYTKSADCILNFAANDYLSLTSEPEIRQAYIEGFELYPHGSGGSMLLSGYHEIHEEFEQRCAKLLNVEKVLLYPSGYVANLSLGYLLKFLNDKVFIDKNIHASVYDGLKIAGVDFQRYLSSNLESLKSKIDALKEKNSIVITESVFSTTGTISNLEEFKKIHSQLALIVDEAHGFGVFGPNGLGLCQNSDLHIPLRIIPFGKSMSASGAIIAGDSAYIDMLLQLSRPLIYSTAISPAFTYGLLKTLEFVQHAQSRREHLFALIAYFNKLKAESSLNWHPSSSLIHLLMLGCPIKALEYKEKLLKKGIFCMPLRQPTVTKTQTGLRIVLNYAHSFENIEYLIQCLEEI